MQNFDKLYILADALADAQLAGKLDKQGRPLIEHCRRVAETCRLRGLSPEQRIAAVLHDVLEDGEMNYEGLKTLHILFGNDVGDLVENLTRTKNETYEDYIDYIIESGPLAVPIKIADLQDNLDESRGPIPDSLKARYKKALITLTNAQTSANQARS
jgi:(p)ppGpp synthase/HD superfamily hydrolase